MAYSSRKLNFLFDGVLGETYDLVTISDHIEIESTINSQNQQFNESEINIKENVINVAAAELTEKKSSSSSKPTAIPLIRDVNTINNLVDINQEDFYDSKTIIIENTNEQNHPNNEYFEILIEQGSGDENVDIKEQINPELILSVNNNNTTKKQSRSKSKKSEDAVSFLLNNQLFKTGKIRPVITSTLTSDNGTITDARKHKCQVCHKQFLRKSNLVDHLRLHANLKLFQCDQCDKSFVQAGNFRAHYRIHTKERPYKCNICFKTYNQSGALKVHMRNHTNEKNYKCSFCGKAFTNSSDLHKHERIHDEKKKIKCLHCDKMFAQKNNLRNHVIIHHPIDVKNIKIESTEQNPKSKRK